MLDWYSKPPLDAFALQLQKQADDLVELEGEILKPGPDNIAAQIAMSLGEEFLRIARSYSPVDTGLLRDSHQAGQLEIGQSGNSVEASVIIDIDPNAPENEIWGGFPVVYGAEYHAERLQWFELAAMDMAPLIDRLAGDMFTAYIEDLWR